MNEPGDQEYEIQCQGPADTGMQTWLPIKVRQDSKLNCKNSKCEVYDTHYHHLTAQKFPGLLDPLRRQPVVAVRQLTAETGAFF